MTKELVFVTMIGLRPDAWRQFSLSALWVSSNEPCVSRSRVSVLPHAASLLKTGILILAGFSLGGCGVTGSVSPVTVRPSPAVSDSSISMRVGRVWVASTAAVNHNVAAYNWGRFGENDRTAIEESLRQSLMEAGMTTSSGAPIVRVAIARYMLAFSNTRASVLVIFDWTTERGGVLNETERLYAAYDTGEGMSVWTLGGVKTRINRDVVLAVMDRALARERGLVTPSLPKLVHTDQQAALAELPAVITGALDPALASQMLGAVLGGSSAETHYARNAEPPETDWTLVINAERAQEPVSPGSKPSTSNRSEATKAAQGK